jgi:hypothetical protein
VSKRTTITGPDGQQIVIVEQKHGCLWWLGTGFLAFIVIGGLVASGLILPLLIIAAFIIVIGGPVYLLATRGYGDTRPPLRKGKRGQSRWSVNKKWWWDGENWRKPNANA